MIRLVTILYVTQPIPLYSLSTNSIYRNVHGQSHSQDVTEMTTNRKALERIMSESAVDERRVELMYNAGAADDECSYHTAYERAAAVDEVIETLEKQKNALEAIKRNLRCYKEAQRSVEDAIMQVQKTIDQEYDVVGRFWAEQPEDFRRIGQKNAVNVYYLLSADTIDQSIGAMLIGKKKVINDIMSEKGIDDLKELILK